MQSDVVTSPSKSIPAAILIALAFGPGWPLMYGVVELPVLTFRWMTRFVVSAFPRLPPWGHKLWLYREEIRIAVICALNVTGWFYFSGLGLTMLSSGRATILAYTHPLAFLIAYAMGRDQLTMRRFLALFCGCVPSPPCRPGFPSFGIALRRARHLGRRGLFCDRCDVAKRIGARRPCARWLADDPAAFRFDLGTDIRSGPFRGVTLTVPRGRPHSIGRQYDGFVLWIKILELIPAPIATISLLPVPMVGITSGVLILGESVGWQEGVAVLLITTALASTLNLPSKKNAQKNPPPPKP